MNWYTNAFAKQPIGVMIGTAVAVGGIGYLGYRIFRKTNGGMPDPKELPNAGDGIPVVGTGADGKPLSWNPTPLAMELHTTMDGFWGTPKNKEVAWAKLNNLPTNDMVVAVYNTFNSIPDVIESKDGTLVNWIRDEVGYLFSTSWKDRVLARLASLQLP